MRYLVTGAGGFIGFHVAQALLGRGDAVIGLDNMNDYYDPALKYDRVERLLHYPGFTFLKGDIADYELLSEVFENHDLGKVCHLAAQAGVRYSLENPFIYERSNVLGFLNILEACRRFKLDMVYASSSSVYGGNTKIPFSMQDRTDSPISLYAATKKANELMAYTYHHLYGIRCTGLRFFTVYGPWGRPDMALFKFTKAILEGKEIEVYNHARMKRDFTYIEDIVAGVLAALDKEYDCEVFNLGNSQPVELSYFIECLEKKLGRAARKKMLPMQPGDVEATYADIEYSTDWLGFLPKTSIEKGISEFVDWYLSYYRNP